MSLKLDLHLLDEAYGITLLPPGDPIPAWADGPGLVSIGRFDDELSIVCPEQRVPPEVETDGDWRAIVFTGSFDFDETGVMLSVIRPLTEAGIGVFVISTYRRDYLLVKAVNLPKAAPLLMEAGHRFVENRT